MKVIVNFDENGQSIQSIIEELLLDYINDK